MDEYEVIIEPSAEEDLKNIYNYISEKLQSTMNAKRQLLRLRLGIKDLEIMPESYHLYPHEPWHSRGLHYYPVGNYEIFYMVDQDNHKVNVVRVLYGQMIFLEIWK